MLDDDAGAYRVDYDPDRDFLRLEFVGRLTPRLLLEQSRATFTTPGVSERTRILVVCVDADISTIDLSAFLAYQELKAARGLPNVCAALVLSDEPGHRALGELWVATRPPIEAARAAVFTEESAALDWLLSGA